MAFTEGNLVVELPSPDTSLLLFAVASAPKLDNVICAGVT